MIRDIYYFFKNGLFSFLRLRSIGARAMVIKDNQILLVKHTYRPKWYTVGGGVDARESMIDAVKREVWEEAGIVCKQEPKLFGVYFNIYKRRDDYIALYVVNDFEEHPSSSLEIKEKRWFPLNALPEDATESTKRRVAEYLGQIKQTEQW